ncbi:hypothetical protein AA313_de0203517 [Arthrobotrys entomopaga]|nr:hypothetical protein AA313_de0203517 [Arthrobotrys entomopaga]
MKQEESEMQTDTLNPLTPPYPQNNGEFEEDQVEQHLNNLKSEDSNENQDVESDQNDQENEIPKSNTVAPTKKSDAVKIKQTSTNVEPEKTPKKRGRPKMTDQEREDKAKKLKMEIKPKSTPSPKKEPTEKSKPNTIKNEQVDTGEKKTARVKKGSSIQFNPAQDAFIRDIFTNPKNEKLSVAKKHERFEGIFKTGISQNSLRFRWYKLRDMGTFLTGEEEAKLKDAIKATKATEKDISKVLKEYSKGGEDTTKISHAYILKKMKEWKIEEEEEDHGGEEDGEEDGEEVGEEVGENEADKQN